MKPLEQVVNDALRDPLAAARTHVAEGGRAIGYFGGEVPVELILASGSFALKLPSSPSSSAAADLYLESSFSADVRAIAEQYLQGRFDFLTAIILPRSNDSAQRLYYYLVELRARRVVGGPVPLIYDLAKISRDTSVAHSRFATQRLAAELGVREERLAASITIRNRRRVLLQEVAALRSRRAGPQGSVMERAARAADFCVADVFDQSLVQWIASAAPGVSGPRLLLAGSVPPDDRLHRAAESAGGNIIAELGEHASCSAALPVIDPQGSIADIADHYQSLGLSSRAFADRAALTRESALSLSVAGVVIWLTEQEDALIWDLPAQMAALAAAGVAALPLVRRSWDDLRAGDEIMSFTRRLKAST